MHKELNEDVLIWLDLETTGLNANHGMILEVGAVIVETKSLEVLDSRSWVVRPIRDTVKGGFMAMVQLAGIEEVKARADDFVKKMHTENGLWDEVALTSQTLIDVGMEFPRWLQKNRLDVNHETFTMVGNGPDRFDRPWLRHNWEHLNRLDDLFHYRSLDISNLKHAFKKAGVPLETPNQSIAHRAVPDCFQSIEDWKSIRTKMWQLT